MTIYNARLKSKAETILVFSADPGLCVQHGVSSIMQGRNVQV